MWQQRTNVLMDRKLHLRVCLYEQDCDKLAGNLCCRVNRLLFHDTWDIDHGLLSLINMVIKLGNCWHYDIGECCNNTIIICMILTWSVEQPSRIRPSFTSLAINKPAFWMHTCPIRWSWCYQKLGIVCPAFITLTDLHAERSEQALRGPAWQAVTSVCWVLQQGHHLCRCGVTLHLGWHHWCELLILIKLWHL